MKKYLFILLLATISVLLISCSRATDIFDYVDVSFSGFETNGQARVIIDEDSLLETVFPGYDEFTQFAQIITFLEGISVRMDRNSGLSNGESITVIIDVSCDNVRGGERTFEVEGLDPIVNISDEELVQFFDIAFSGMSGSGSAEVVLSQGVGVFTGFTVLPYENLANGDSIFVEVNKENFLAQGFLLTGTGVMSVTVSGLEYATLLSEEYVLNNVSLSFMGTNTRGSAEVITSFGNEMNRLEFEVVNNGTLTNGDEVEVHLTEESRNFLFSLGYAFEEEILTFTVEGLNVVAGSVEDIRNLENLMYMFAQHFYRDFGGDYTYEEYREREGRVSGDRFEIIFHGYFYRELGINENMDVLMTPVFFVNTPVNGDGTLIGIYSVRHYNKMGLAGVERLRSEYYLVFGFTSLFLDERGEVNTATLTPLSTRYDMTFSANSLIQKAEGLGYFRVMVE